MPGLDVLGHHAHAAHQILAALGERRAQQFGIGGDEVRRRQRARHLAQIELRLVARVRIEVVGALDEIVGPARRQHIGLFEEIEIGIVAPFGIGEALVARLGRGDRRRLFALQPAQRRGPEIRRTGSTAPLCASKRALRVGDVIFGDAAERRDSVGDLAGSAARRPRRRLARLQIGGEHLAAFLDQPRDIARQRFEIGQRRLAGAAGRRLSGRLGRRCGGAAVLAGAACAAAQRAVAAGSIGGDRRAGGGRDAADVRLDRAEDSASLPAALRAGRLRVRLVRPSVDFLACVSLRRGAARLQSRFRHNMPLGRRQGYTLVRLRWRHCGVVAAPGTKGWGSTCRETNGGFGARAAGLSRGGA